MMNAFDERKPRMVEGGLWGMMSRGQAPVKRRMQPAGWRPAAVYGSDRGRQKFVHDSVAAWNKGMNLERFVIRSIGAEKAVA
jgi:hypothetical protein